MNTILLPVETLIPNIILTEHSDRLFCSVCAQNSIPLPPEATQKTNFTCRSCCDALLKSRDPETSDAIAEIGAEIDARVTRESFAGTPGDISTGRSK